jgi:hypothetical protein
MQPAHLPGRRMLTVAVYSSGACSSHGLVPRRAARGGSESHDGWGRAPREPYAQARCRRRVIARRPPMAGTRPRKTLRSGAHNCPRWEYSRVRSWLCGQDSRPRPRCHRRRDPLPRGERHRLPVLTAGAAPCFWRHPTGPVAASQCDYRAGVLALFLARGSHERVGKVQRH